eukprot:scaffold1981_cov110-Isochrysis_galbana.AAC.1
MISDVDERTGNPSVRTDSDGGGAAGLCEGPDVAGCASKRASRCSKRLAAVGAWFGCSTPPPHRCGGGGNVPGHPRRHRHRVARDGGKPVHGSSARVAARVRPS